jgi:bacterioferritin-associated ferredoxin
MCYGVDPHPATRPIARLKIMKRILSAPMADARNPNKAATSQDVRAAPGAAPACARGGELAEDVLAEVTAACPRCAATGRDCLIDLMHRAAFPSDRWQ